MATSTPSLSRSWKFKTLLIVTVAAAVISAIRAAFNLGYYYSAFGCYGTFDPICPISVVGSFILSITFGLVVASIGMWWRRLATLLISFFALVWSAGMYLLWYRFTLSVLRNAEVAVFSQLPAQQQYLLPLDDAGWWDVVVLAIVIILLVWHINTLGPFLLQLVRNRRPRKSGSGEHSAISRDARQELDHLVS